MDCLFKTGVCKLWLWIPPVGALPLLLLSVSTHTRCSPPIGSRHILSASTYEPCLLTYKLCSQMSGVSRCKVCADHVGSLFRVCCFTCMQPVTQQGTSWVQGFDGLMALAPHNGRLTYPCTTWWECRDSGPQWLPERREPWACGAASEWSFPDLGFSTLCFVLFKSYWIWLWVWIMCSELYILVDIFVILLCYYCKWEIEVLYAWWITCFSLVLAACIFMLYVFS